MHVLRADLTARVHFCEQTDAFSGEQISEVMWTVETVTVCVCVCVSSPSFFVFLRIGLSRVGIFFAISVRVTFFWFRPSAVRILFYVRAASSTWARPPVLPFCSLAVECPPLQHSHLPTPSHTPPPAHHSALPRGRVFGRCLRVSLSLSLSLSDFFPGGCGEGGDIASPSFSSAMYYLALCFLCSSRSLCPWCMGAVLLGRT